MKDYDKAKSKQLEKLADKMLKDDERNQQLKEKEIQINFDLFEDEREEEES